MANPGKGDLLASLLRGYRSEGIEKSFKMSARSLLSDRFLFGVHKADISPAELISVCARMGMPEMFIASLRTNAGEANAFHFGFEGTAGGGIYKVYLEFAGRLANAPPAVPGSEGMLLHLAYKWDALNPSVRTIAQYRCWPKLSEAAVRSKVAALYANDAGCIALKGIGDLIGLSTARAGVAPMYLEVREEGNPRASCDLNFHEGDIGVTEAGPWLSRLRAHYSIADEAFMPVYEAASDSALGHVSGGTNRHGEDFVTVYYPAGSL